MEFYLKELWFKFNERLKHGQKLIPENGAHPSGQQIRSFAVS